MEKLKELRSAKGITQSQLGEYIGAKKSAVCLWESGKRQPDQETLVRLASFFSVTVDYLLGNDAADSQTQEKAPAGTIDEQIMKELEGADIDLAKEVLSFIRFRKQGG